MDQFKEADIHSPDHYTAGGIEVIDYIRAKLTPEQYEGYLAGNIIKYISRYQHKGKDKDLKKADVYLKWLIEHVQYNKKEVSRIE